MAEVVQRAADSDPKALRARIRELERAAQQTATAQPAQVSEAELDSIRKEAQRLAQASADESIGGIQAEAREIAKGVREALDSLILVADQADRLIEREVAVVAPAVVHRRTHTPPRTSAPSPRRTNGATTDLGGGCLRMLVALASRAPAGFTVAQWATLAKLKRTGGTWSTYLSKLKVAGYVEKRGELWYATEAGIEAAGELPPQAQSPDELIAMWKSSVGGGAARMLDAIALAEPGGLSLDDLAEAVGITRSGGTFGTYLSRLKSNELIDRDGGGVRLSDVLR